MRSARIVVAVVIVALLAGCGGSGGDATDMSAVRFGDQHKDGDEALIVVGDYFHHRYVLELLQIMRALPPGARRVVFCTAQFRDPLEDFLAANDVRGVEYHTMDADSPLIDRWARDIVVAGHDPAGRGVMVVSPDKHAGSERDAGAAARVLGEAFPDYEVRVAPFVFEGGNLAFVDGVDERVLIVGQKVLFDNAVYQSRPWTRGLDRTGLDAAIRETFGVDRVIVVGKVRERPPSHLYFEYHIDMGLVVLDNHRAAVSRLDFDDADRAAIDAAIAGGEAVVSSFAAIDDAEQLDVLSRRLETVAAEYDEYARVLADIGLVVYRIDVGWREVVSSMSWTNVVQADNRILMPLYPDTLRAVTRSVDVDDGRTRVSLDVSVVGDESFGEAGRNRGRAELYRRLGYDVVAIPEYLHYMMGGVHCFANLLH